MFTLASVHADVGISDLLSCFVSGKIFNPYMFDSCKKI